MAPAGAAPSGAHAAPDQDSCGASIPGRLRFPGPHDSLAQSADVPRRVAQGTAAHPHRAPAKDAADVVEPGRDDSRPAQPVYPRRPALLPPCPTADAVQPGLLPRTAHREMVAAKAHATRACMVAR